MSLYFKFKNGLRKIVTKSQVTKVNVTKSRLHCIFNLQAGGPISRFLQQVKVPHVTSQECNNDYANIGGITQGMICAGKKGKDSCQVKIINT